MHRRSHVLFLLAPLAALPSFAQQPIAYVPVEGVSLSGSLAVANGKASIGNNGTITAGDETAKITLARGGDVALCASTKIHLSKDNSVAGASSPAAGGDAPADAPLMIALDRGALETDYTAGKYSDVLLTPDLRILISGPGAAKLKIRVNQKGDTCVDNHGADAPYVTVTSQFEDGAYRVKADQRVLFEHGSLQQVVDNEKEPCGCPAAVPVSVASTGVTDAANPAKPGEKVATMPVGGPSSTPADTEFPLAVSEGLKPPPPEPTQPEVAEGIPHVQVAAPIAYSSALTPNPAAAGAAGPEPAAAPSSAGTATVGADSGGSAPAAVPVALPTAAETASAPAPVQKKPGGFFHSIGRFFGHIFGR